MPLDRDTSTLISLIGTTERLHSLRGDRREAIVELQQIAAGRTDLLASAAGHFLGMNTWTIVEQTTACMERHQLLVDAGAEPELVQAAAERTRANLGNYGHTSVGTQPPPRR